MGLFVIENHSGLTEADAQAMVSGTGIFAIGENADYDDIVYFPVTSGCNWYIYPAAGITPAILQSGLSVGYVFVDKSDGIQQVIK